MKYPVGPLYSPLAESDVLIHQTMENSEQLDNLPNLTASCCKNKNLVIQPKAFGIPLTKLVKKTSTKFCVPFVLMRICHFIEEKGVDKIDLSWRSKNAQLVESLRIAFDETGNAPLEAECDALTATVLLEIFLHQLPDPVIPKDTLPAYVLAVQDIQKDKESCVLKLKGLVEKLPLDNFNTLKFITQFIFRVNQKYNQRKEIMIMGFSLGSKIFRFTYDGENLKNHLVCNVLMDLLVYDNNIIFGNDVHQLYEDKSLRIKCTADKNTLNAQESEGVISTCSLKSVLNLCSAAADPSVNLKPLSIIIPPMEKYNAENVSLQAQVPTLLVDSSVIQSYKEPMVKCLDMHTIQQQSLPQQGRKRKEHRPSKEESVLIKSSFVEQKSVDPVMFREFSQNINEDETRIMVPLDTTVVETREPNVSSPKWCDHLWYMHTAELSPHPPLAKRQELESSELEYKKPIQDLVVQSDSIFETCSLNAFHEAQRNAERLAPLKQPLYQKSMHKVNSVMDKQLKSMAESCEKIESDVRRRNSCFSKVPVKTYKNSVTKIEENCEDSFKENYERNKNCLSDGLHTQSNNKYGSCDKYGHYLSVCKHQASEKIPVLHSSSKLSHPLLELHPVNTVDAHYYSDDDTCNENNIPSFDFTFSSDYEDVQEPVLSEHRHSWPLTTSSLEDPMLSPSFYHLKKTNFCEASLSPSAGICLPHLRSLDPNIPPSSPKDQHVFTNRLFKSKDKVTSSVKELTKKIHKLKKKIRHFEENFERDCGFRPSHADKMNYPEVKKMMSELTQLRKHLKVVREEQQLEQDSVDYIFTHFTDKSGHVGHTDLSDCYKFPVEKVLDKGKEHLSEEKHVTIPEIVEDMTGDQLMFKKSPGQPLMDNQKEVTYPLYDRCRNVKRMSGRISVFGNSLGKEPVTELQPILEHVAMDFKSPERSGLMGQIENSPSSLTEASPSVLLPQEEHTHAEIKKGDVFKHGEKSVTAEFSNSNFHELSLPELLQQRRQIRLEKRRLRKILREFEEEFCRKNGKKVQKEDKISVEPMYSEYKHTKGKLKLLEALVTKHELHHRI